MKFDTDSKTPAGLPLTIGVEGDQLVIRIGIDTLAWCFEISEANHRYDEIVSDYRREFKVIDRYRFAQGVAEGLTSERGEDGSTWLTAALDKACEDAIESDMGVQEDGRIVTQDMLRP